MVRQKQNFQLGQFGKGLITGLIFGLIFAALLAWMIGSRPLPKDPSRSANTPTDCSVCLENAGKNAKTTAPKQFSYYQGENKSEPDPYTRAAIATQVPTTETPSPSAPPRNTIPVAPPQSTTPATPTNVSPADPKTSTYLRTKLYNKLVDVEAIKAELALMGYEPKMKVKNGQFLLQMGPYQSQEQAEKARKDLGDQGAVFSVQ